MYQNTDNWYSQILSDILNDTNKEISGPEDLSKKEKDIELKSTEVINRLLKKHNRMILINEEWLYLYYRW